MIIFLSITIPQVFAVRTPSLDYDLDLVDLKVLEVQVIPVDDTPNYPYDDSDLLKITVSLTNNGLETFILIDRMFEVRVMKAGYIEDGLSHENLSIVDNYSPAHDDGLEVKYDEFDNQGIFKSCDDFNNLLPIGQAKVFTLCYDVVRAWKNEVLDIDGPKKHYLVMMNNQFATSCPNCIKILLSQTKQMPSNFPTWLEQLFSWHDEGLINTNEFENAILYYEELFSQKLS